MRFMSGFVAGLLVGIAAGVAGVVAYAVQTDQDVRELFRGMQKSIEDVDLEAVGAQVQQGITEAQARVEVGIAKAREKTRAPDGDGPQDADAADMAEVAKA